MGETVMALDVGTHRIGVAVSDEERQMALPLQTVDASCQRRAVEKIVDLATDYKVGELVVGWPLDMRGVEGRAVDRVRQIVDELAVEFQRRGRKPLPIRRWDERLSTSAADRLLIEADVSRTRRKEAVDQVAACKILEAFLAKQNQRGE